MKIMLIGLLFITLFLRAYENNKFSFSFDNCTVLEAFELIAEKTGVNLVYPVSEGYEPISFDLNECTVSEALNRVAASFNMEAVQLEDVYVIRSKMIQLSGNRDSSPAEGKDTGSGEVTITGIYFDSREIEVEYSGEKFRLKEGQTLKGKIELIRVVSPEEVLIYYPVVSY